MKSTILMILLAASLLTAGDAQVFQAMNLELSRAMKDLRIETMEKPYFISLRFTDAGEMSAGAAFGKITSERLDPKENHYRFVQAVVRVGAPELDNTNFKGGSFRSDYSDMSAIPLTDDVEVLREEFWLAIDGAYKRSLSTFAEKKGYLEKHPQEDYPPDFLPAPAAGNFTGHEPPMMTSAGMADFVKGLSAGLRRYPFLSEGTADLSVIRLNQYYLDSEGNRHIRPSALMTLSVGMKAYTKEWYPLSRSLTWIVSDPGALPPQADILKAVEVDALYLQALQTVKPLEEYTGPVLFEGEAAGGFFLNLLGKGLSNPREVLASEQAGYFMEMLSGKEGFLGKRFGSRILPEGFRVVDRPVQESFQGKALAGFMPVDDEGMKSGEVVLVEKGRLIGLPMTRAAVKKFKEVNGHAVGGLFQAPKASVTNLFIEDARGLDARAFKEKIKALAKEQGKEEILVVRAFEGASQDITAMVLRMGGGGTPSLLDPPARAYLVNVATGEERPVWGMEFRDVTPDILQKIAASGADAGLYQFSQALRNLGGRPVSIIAPDILVEEMSLQKAKLEKLRPPLTPMPELK